MCLTSSRIGELTIVVVGGWRRQIPSQHGYLLDELSIICHIPEHCDLQIPCCENLTSL